MFHAGAWFDGRSKPTQLVLEADLPDFAPAFILQHPKEYRHLLIHPDNRTDLEALPSSQVWHFEQPWEVKMLNWNWAEYLEN